MASNGNPEVSRRIALSSLGTLAVSALCFYLGNRYGEALASYPGSSSSTGATPSAACGTSSVPSPRTSTPARRRCSSASASSSSCGSSGCATWPFIGNYRAGEESGSARWGTLKEGRAFRDATNEDNNLIFTKNFGLALHRPKFDPELDRNLNVLVVGGSGSGKTFNYVTPNIMQLNTSYFITDPKGTLLKDAGSCSRTTATRFARSIRLAWTSPCTTTR